MIRRSHTVKKLYFATKIEQLYQRKTPIEHVLIRPDTYVGSTDTQATQSWVIRERDKRVVHEPITYVPALYKIFDEILVNALDNRQRDARMTRLDIDVDVAANRIAVENNGRGIPIVLHEKEQLYVPELIMGHLLTGSNFDDSVAKITGGRNGYGAKLCNIFSDRFEIETADAARRLRYRQVWRDNMTRCEPPRIEPLQRGVADYTRVTFMPDLSRFGGMQTLADTDLLRVLRRRAHDAAACTPDVRVRWNGELIEPRNFEGYARLHEAVDRSGGQALVFVKSKRWHVGIGVARPALQGGTAAGGMSAAHVSFVNGIATPRGGTHVAHVASTVANAVVRIIERKHKQLKPRAAHVRGVMALFVACQVDNPAFDSQTKETLTTRAADFGVPFELSERVVQRVIAESGIVDAVVRQLELRQLRKLDAAANKRKSASGAIVGLPKLQDAHWAGTARSKECTLILTEGDSAKALAVAGLAEIGRDKYGVFPLRGKLLNVRDANPQRVLENAELAAVKTILGLRHGDGDKQRKLRYGKVMLMTDQDPDGSHIKGLFINFIHNFWPQLLKSNNFLEEFVTPLVKATRAGHDTQSFFTVAEYERWRDALPPAEAHLWTQKYYKGLGTSTAAEAREYFSNLAQHRLRFVWHKDAVDNKLVQMAFGREQVSERKRWLEQYVGDDANDVATIDHSRDSLTYGDFVNRELVLFSRLSLTRAVPRLLDGLKPGQRKVLYACFRRRLTKEIKVAQLAGYVAEHTNYHHGEAALAATIIGMAQEYCGANNVSLLVPAGQFGTRLLGGKDAASPRYLFTRLAPVARLLFREEDDAVLQRAVEDGDVVQPIAYAPVLPLVLLNGAHGVGTGWSTSVPPYHPLDVLRNVRRALRGEPLEIMLPWFRFFQGEVAWTPASLRDGSLTDIVTRGVASATSKNTIEITELPIGRWTTKQKEHLEEMAEIGTIESFRELHSEHSVHFIVKVSPRHMREYARSPTAMTRAFRLQSRLSLRNMHLFDAAGRLQRYESPEDILTAFVAERRPIYEQRRLHQLKTLASEAKVLAIRHRFTRFMVHEDGNRLLGRPRAELLAELRARDFPTHLAADTARAPGDDFDYLLRASVKSFTAERVEQLERDLANKEQQVNVLRKQTADDLWLQDLDQLEAHWAKDKQMATHGA